MTIRAKSHLVMIAKVQFFGYVMGVKQYKTVAFIHRTIVMLSSHCNAGLALMNYVISGSQEGSDRSARQSPDEARMLMML